MNTAKSATGTTEQIIFASRQHKDFYYMALDKVVIVMLRGKLFILPWD